MNFSKPIVLKGHGFSRAVKSFNGFAALAVEECNWLKNFSSGAKARVNVGGSFGTTKDVPSQSCDLG
jgi:hypothetical protein